MLKILVTVILGAAIFLAAAVQSGNAIQNTLVQLEVANGPTGGPARLVP